MKPWKLYALGAGLFVAGFFIGRSSLEELPEPLEPSTIAGKAESVDSNKQMENELARLRSQLERAEARNEGLASELDIERRRNEELASERDHWMKEAERLGIELDRLKNPPFYQGEELYSEAIGYFTDQAPTDPFQIMYFMRIVASQFELVEQDIVLVDDASGVYAKKVIIEELPSGDSYIEIRCETPSDYKVILALPDIDAEGRDQDRENVRITASITRYMNLPGQYDLELDLTADRLPGIGKRKVHYDFYSDYIIPEVDDYGRKTIIPDSYNTDQEVNLFGAYFVPMLN